MIDIVTEISPLIENESGLLLNDPLFAEYVKESIVMLAIGEWSIETIIQLVQGAYFFGVLSERKRKAMDELLNGGIMKGQDNVVY